MNRFQSTLGAALFCLSASFAFAQAPAGDAGKGPGMMGGGERHGMKPCSQEPDPAKCEANRKQMRESMKAAHEACKNNADPRGCMTKEVCSKQADPAKCFEHAKERQAKMSKHMDERQAMAEACSGKRGDALQQCYREQHQKRGGGKSDKKG